MHHSAAYAVQYGSVLPALPPHTQHVRCVCQQHHNLCNTLCTVCVVLECFVRHAAVKLCCIVHMYSRCMCRAASAHLPVCSLLLLCVCCLLRHCRHLLFGQLSLLRDVRAKFQRRLRALPAAAMLATGSVSRRLGLVNSDMASMQICNWVVEQHAACAAAVTVWRARSSSCSLLHRQQYSGRQTSPSNCQ